jgi:hypothetical protein
LGLIGLVLWLLDLRGCFVDREKVEFAELVLNSVREIPRGASPAFERFLEDFPPPGGVDPRTVTHIGDKSLRWDTSPAESVAVVYVAAGMRTPPVARPDQVAAWASSGPYGVISWMVAAGGWAVYAAVELLEFLHERKSARVSA